MDDSVFLVVYDNFGGRASAGKDTHNSKESIATRVNMAARPWRKSGSRNDISALKSGRRVSLPSASSQARGMDWLS